MDKRHTVTCLAKIAGLLWSLTFLTTLAACAKPPEIQPQPSEEIAQYELLSFIQDGVTTRAEVLDKLGTPSAEFEGQRILTYRIKVDKEGAKPSRAPWKPGMFSLVLVFGDNGLVEKHSLVGGSDTQ